MKIRPLISTAILLLPILCGCAHVKANPYETRFNQVLQWGTSKHFVTGQKFEALSSQVSSGLYTLGYGHPVYENPALGFMAVNKNSVEDAGKAGDPDTPQIMVKFTQWEGGQTRVDFATGQTTVLAAAKTAERDINALMTVLKAKGFFNSEQVPVTENPKP